MTELLITDITRMQPGYCVIGIEPTETGFRSVRPVPVRSNRWFNFPFRRADKLTFDSFATPCERPHFEDLGGANHRKLGAVTEDELIRCLRKAEVGRTLKELFGCPPRLSWAGSQAVYVKPDEAQRSICGCYFKSIRFSFEFYPPKVRVALALESGETLANLPLVDRDWNNFIDEFARRAKNDPAASLDLADYFENFIEEKLISSPSRFARIGLARPFRGKRCWLMLDSLFPLPRPEWK
jgi:hypothetical protein